MSTCHHAFMFLRQERTNVGFDRNPRWLYEDVFFCERCLAYKRIPIKETAPSRDHFGEDIVTRYTPCHEASSDS